MRKDFGAKAVVAPLPVLIIGTYDANGTPNAMNVAWGGQCGPKHISLSLASHKTTDNIKLKQAFTVSLADQKNLVAADYFGIASGNDLNKIEKAGVQVTKSNFVDAPIIEAFPLTLECKVVSIQEEFGETRVVGEIVNLSVDEAYVGADGKIDLGKMQLLSFDSAILAYRVLGDKVGNAFKDGAALK